MLFLNQDTNHCGLAIFIRQRQSNLGEKLVNSNVHLWGEFVGELVGQHHQKVVKEDLEKKKESMSAHQNATFHNFLFCS